MAKSGMKRRRAEREESSSKIVAFGLAFTIWVAVVIFLVLPIRDELNTANTELNNARQNAPQGLNEPHVPSSAEIDNLNQILPEKVDKKTATELGKKIASRFNFTLNDAQLVGVAREEDKVTAQDATISLSGTSRELPVVLNSLINTIREDNDTGLLLTQNNMNFFIVRGIDFNQASDPLKATYQLQITMYAFK